jgi:multiple sugar transport system substrate-binding protein
MSNEVVDLTDKVLTRRRVLGYGLAALASAGAGCAPRQKDERTTIRYMAWGNPEQLAVERQIADEFERLNPKVRVHLVMVPGSSYADKLQLMLASRTAPDVMRVDHYYYPALVRKGYFLPLMPFIEQEGGDFLADFSPVALDECRYRGELYAMNVLFGPVILYYNKALFAAAGLPEPYGLAKQGRWAWDTFVNATERLTKRGKDGRPTQFGVNMVTYPMYSSVIWNQGGDFMNSSLTRFTLGDDPKAVEGIAAYAGLRWDSQSAPTPADNALSPFTFESGKIGMHWGWAGESPRFRKNIKDFDWDIAPTPSGPAGNWAVVKGNQIVIYKNSRYPELAWEFVKFMTGRETELRLCGDLRRAVPTRLSVQRDPRYLRADKPPFHTDVFLDSVRRGRTLPIDWRYQEWLQEYNAATDGLFNTHSDTAAAAARAATDRVNALLASEEGF